MLVQCDLAQAELRCMAALSDDQWMLAALQENQGDFFDTHMMPVCFPQVDPNLLKADPVLKKELRTKVKTIQYGLAFGRQAYAISVELGISPAEAQTIIDNYLLAAPQFAQWRLDVMEAAINPAKRDLLISPFGRKFQSEIITHKNQGNVQREALSFLPQATASDICLVTAIRVHPQIKAMGCHIVALVHDAIIVDVPHKFDPNKQQNEVLAHKVGLLIQSEFRRTGEMVFGNKVPLLSEFSIGRSWGDLL